MHYAGDNILGEKKSNVIKEASQINMLKKNAIFFKKKKVEDQSLITRYRLGRKQVMFRPA